MQLRQKRPITGKENVLVRAQKAQTRESLKFGSQAEHTTILAVTALLNKENVDRVQLNSVNEKHRLQKEGLTQPSRSTTKPFQI